MAAPSKQVLQPVVRHNSALFAFLPASQWVDVVAVSGVAANYTVPTGSVFLRLTPNAGAGATYGNFNGVAAVPSAVVNGSGSFPIPAGLSIMAPKAGSTLSLVGSGAGFVSIEVWS